MPDELNIEGSAIDPPVVFGGTSEVTLGGARWDAVEQIEVRILQSDGPPTLLAVVRSPLDADRPYGGWPCGPLEFTSGGQRVQLKNRWTLWKCAPHHFLLRADPPLQARDQQMSNSGHIR